LRIASIALMLVLGVGMLAGCGNADDTSHPRPDLAKEAPPAKGGTDAVNGAPTPSRPPGASAGYEPGTKVK